MKWKETCFLHTETYQSNVFFIKNNKRNIFIDTDRAGWILFEAIRLFIILWKYHINYSKFLSYGKINPIIYS